METSVESVLQQSSEIEQIQRNVCREVTEETVIINRAKEELIFLEHAQQSPIDLLQKADLAEKYASDLEAWCRQQETLNDFRRKELESLLRQKAELEKELTTKRSGNIVFRNFPLFRAQRAKAEEEKRRRLCEMGEFWEAKPAVKAMQDLAKRLKALEEEGHD